MKKVLSLILTLVMVFSLVPFTALAAAGDSAEEPITNDAASIGGLTAQYLYLGGDPASVTLAPTLTGGNAPESATDVTWSFESTTPTVATVDATGVVTAVKGGTTTINVTAEWSVTTVTGTGESAVSTTKYYKETGRVGIGVRSLVVESAITLAKGASYVVANAGAGSISLVEKEDTNNIITVSGTTIRANAAGTAVVTAQMGDKLSQDIAVTVKDVNKVELKDALGNTLGSSLSVGANDSVVLEAVVTDSASQPVEGVEITWTSSNEKVATVADGVVTIVGAGTTTIKAAAASNKYDSVVLNVAGISGITGISATTPIVTLGSKLNLTAGIIGVSGSYVVDWTSSNTSVITVEGAERDTRNATLLAVGKGSATVTATLYKITSGVRTEMDSESITVTVKGMDYTLTTSGALSMSNTSLLTDISTAFKNLTGKTMTKITVTPGDSTVGSLRYTTVIGSYLGGIGSALTKETDLSATEFNSMVFTPVMYGGVYSFSFVVTDGSVSLGGTVTIGAGYKAEDIQVSMSSGAQALTLGSTIGINERNSIYDQISALVAPTKRGAAYISFSNIGTNGSLYTDSGMTEAVKAGSFYNFYNLASMTFRPASGSWTAEYTVYDANQYPIVSGKIIIGGTVSLEYRTTSGGTVYFKDEDFQALWKQNYPNGALSYVTFVYPTDGVIRNNGVALSSLNIGSTKLYAGTTGTGALASASYTAPVVASYGKQTIYFNIWGYTGTGATLQTVPGSLTVYITKNPVSDVTYTTPVNVAKSLNKADFYNMINYALGSANTAWTISFDELPAETNGVLLSYYTSNYSYSKAVAGQEYYYNALDDFRFVPYTSYSGTVTIPFTVSVGSEKVIKSNLIIKVGEGYTYASTSEGVNMKLETFYNSGASDPVAHISFKQPAKGTLYYNYTAGAGAEVTAQDYYYTVPSLVTVTRALPLTGVKYIPEANQSGDVTIEYTAYTASGQTREGSIVIRVVSKTISSQFKDVTATYKWAADSVDFMFHYGIVKGQDTAMTQFGPAGKMSRGDLVLILYRLAGAPSVYGVSNPFTDVKATDYYYNAVMWAYQNGVVDGISATRFAPTGDVTRQQIAAILYRYETKVLKNTATGMKAFTGYTDAAKVQSYAIAPMQWAVGNGYITGTTTTTLDPASNATRAQVAVMLHRYLTY